MKAILSDIHGNLEALQAVLADASKHGAEEIYCLGDVLGHGGPNPRECVELAMQWKVALMGHQDLAAFRDMAGYPDPARNALLWAAAQVQAPVPSQQAAERRTSFLAGLPRMHREGDLLFVHATPRNPLFKYVFPEDVCNGQKMARVFDFPGRCCFAGHTHVPGVFTEDRRFLALEEIGFVYRLGDPKTLVNVGSVDQPRDGDRRACYALLDGETVCFRRVEYDVEATVSKVYAITALENFLGDRLRDGL